jgi:translation initiation factor IF-2
LGTGKENQKGQQLLKNPTAIEKKAKRFFLKKTGQGDGQFEMDIEKIKKDARVRVKRNKEIIGQGKIGQLQSGKQTVNELPEGNEGGLQFDGKLKLEVGDVLEAYTEEEKEKKLVLE